MPRLSLAPAFIALTLAFGVAPAPAFAETAPPQQVAQSNQSAQLDAAKRAGHLGERADGLLGAVSGSIPADARALMERVNAERLAAYRQVASQNNTSVQAVQAVAGEKLIERSAPGTWVNDGSGWRQR